MMDIAQIRQELIDQDQRLAALETQVMFSWHMALQVAYLRQRCADLLLALDNPAPPPPKFTTQPLFSRSPGGYRDLTPAQLWAKTR